MEHKLQPMFETLDADFDELPNPQSTIYEHNDENIDEEDGVEQVKPSE